MKRRPSIRLTEPEAADFVRAHRKAALATLDRDGFPHLVAMNFYEKDGAYWMTSYAKAQKVLNIRRNPKVALMIEAGEAYGELRGLMVRGRCEIIEGEDAVRGAFAAMAAARGATYRRPEAAQDSAPKRVVLKVVPDKTVSWDYTKLGGRY
jgi:PPOX class probable F420-dependent enzyme